MPRVPPARPRPVFGRDDRALDTRLVTLDTEDGHTWDGVLYVPHGPPPGRRSRRGIHAARRRLAVLVVHGSVGNYLTGLPRRISFGLANAGFTVLSVNTRMANYGVFFGGGLMHRVPLDLDPALALLARNGYRRVVMLGFSMGATMATHYLALRQPEQVVGLCTLAHPISLPASLRRRWDHFGADPSYVEVADAATERLGDDPEDPARDRLLVVRRARGPTDAPLHGEIWTYRTWWFSRGPRAPHAESRTSIGRVSVPVAIIQAGEDELVTDAEGPDLARLARQGGAPSVHLDVIPGADHVFSGCDAPLREAVVGWLDGRV